VISLESGGGGKEDTTGTERGKKGEKSTSSSGDRGHRRNGESLVGFRGREEKGEVNASLSLIIKIENGGGGDCRYDEIVSEMEGLPDM